MRMFPARIYIFDILLRIQNKHNADESWRLTNIAKEKPKGVTASGPDRTRHFVRIS